MAKRPGWLDETPEGYIVGRGKSRDLQMGRNKAEMDARANIVKSRMGPKGGSANLRGVRPAEYYTDPKTGTTHVLMDTTKMQFDPVKQDQKALKQAIDDTAVPKKAKKTGKGSAELEAIQRYQQSIKDAGLDNWDVEMPDVSHLRERLSKFGKKK